MKERERERSFRKALDRWSKWKRNMLSGAEPTLAEEAKREVKKVGVIRDGKNLFHSEVA